MKHTKLYLNILLFITLTAFKVHAQEEVQPSFPGGMPEFSKYILKNLKYPDVAAVVGLTGKVNVNFVVEKDGSVVDVKPMKCLGAGCESEAVRVIAMSPKWSPGILYGKNVRVMYTIPVSFAPNGPSKPTELDKLRKSKYGFVFYIKGNTYTINEAENLLGKSFDPTAIETVEAYDNSKYAMPDKKGVYLIVMK